MGSGRSAERSAGGRADNICKTHTNILYTYSDEVVQCYVKQPNASVPVPQVRLAAFTRELREDIAPLEEDRGLEADLRLLCARIRERHWALSAGEANA